MDFTEKELKVLLRALYRYRGEVSGASQGEQDKAGFVAGVIEKIEAEASLDKAEAMPKVKARAAAEKPAGKKAQSPKAAGKAGVTKTRSK